MPRRIIPFVPNIYYHLYNRGVNRERIFFEQANYLYFLRGLKDYVLPVADIIAYCLMPNHYHIVVRVKEPLQTSEILNQAPGDLQSIKKISEASVSRETSEVFMPFSRAMKNFLISYSKGMNKRYSRVGTLFQGTFKAKPIETYNYLLNLCIYIHANPVKDGLVEEIKDWPYSNYLEWLGERQGSLVNLEFVRDNFESPREYQALVMQYLKSRDLPEDIKRYLNSLEG